MSALTLRRATVADIPAMSRIRIAVRVGFDEVRLGTAAHTRADRFYAGQGWTREDMKSDVEVWYRLRRADWPARRDDFLDGD